MKSDCILWTGCKNPNGYGVRRIKGKNVGVHRLAWIEANGSIPPGAHICHTCDVRLCINQAHLFAGTHAENMADMILKGRDLKAKGADHYIAKLTESQVIEIRARCAAGETQYKLAAEFKVRQPNVSDIVNRKTWKHI